jgi:transposase
MTVQGNERPAFRRWPFFVLGYCLDKGRLSMDTHRIERFPIDVNRNVTGIPLDPQIRFGMSCDKMQGHGMAKGYSKDLRVRAVELIESGESAREAARILNLGASTTIRWMDRWRKTGNVEAKPGTGHSRSPLDQHKQWLIELIAAEPDLTLEEIRVRLRSQRKQKAGIGSIWRFFDRHDITFKKNTARSRAGSA